MTEDADLSLVAFKQSIRECARANRLAQPGKDRLSHIICRALAELPEYRGRSVGPVLCRHPSRSPHRHLFCPPPLAEGKQVAVPYCSAAGWSCFAWRTWTSSPAEAIRFSNPGPNCAAKASGESAIDEIDLIIVPGVAFDRDGARLGHGLGLLRQSAGRARPETPGWPWHSSVKSFRPFPLPRTTCPCT